MLNVKTSSEVYEIIKEEFSGIDIGAEIVDIKECFGRILDTDICSNEDIPAFNRSTVDGYAVVSSNTFGASETSPALLKLSGSIKMGEKPKIPLNEGCTFYIPTGAQLPENADSVVMIEYTEDFKDGFIQIEKPSSPGNNVIYKADDVKKGETVFKTNHKLRTQDIGVLAALGHNPVRVKRKINVGILSTGNEIVEIEKMTLNAQIRDVNSYLIYSGLVDYGANPKIYGIVPDDFEIMKKAVSRMISENDVILISGGSSVGVKDETLKAIEAQENGKILVHGISVKPGKPTIIARAGNKPVIGLPGHPASCFFIFKTFVINILDNINGITNTFLTKKTVKASLILNIPSNHGREEYIPVKLKPENKEIKAEPVFSKSGLIRLLSASDGFIIIDKGCEGLPKGTEVIVYIF